MICCKKKIPFICLLLFLSFAGLSQSSTLELNKTDQKNGTTDLSGVTFNRVMIIPFEHKMYMSQVDAHLAGKIEQNHEDSSSMAQKQAAIIESFRKGICSNLFIEAKMVHNSTYKALSMYSEDPEIIADLDYIYKSVGYKYTVVPAAPDTAKPSATASLRKASDKAQDIFESRIAKQETAGTRIKDGQISSSPETRERFMNTKIINPDALAYLSSKYECDYFLFVNQMDFVVPPGTDYRDLSTDEYSRLLKMHYTILHRNGTEIYGDAVKTYTSSRLNDVDQIVKTHFDEIAREMLSHLGNPTLQNADREKKKEENKKATRQRSSFDDY